MKSYYQGFVVVLLAIVLSGCAGAYAPELAEEESRRGYEQASQALERARHLEAGERAAEEFEQAQALFEEARRSLEELPDEETAEKFREARALADEASLLAQQAKISEQEEKIGELQEELASAQQIKAELEAGFEDRDVGFDELEDTAARLEKKVTLFEDTVAHKTLELSNARDTIADREAKISALSDTVNRQQIALSARADTIADLEEKLLALKTEPPEGDWAWEQLTRAEVEGGDFTAPISDTTFYRFEHYLDYSSGDAEITSDHRHNLQQVASAFHQFSDHYLLAVGSTDSTPPGPDSEFASNRELGFWRALNAVDLLIEEMGVEPVNAGGLSLGAYGDFRPEAEQMSAAEQRRVEFWLIPFQFLIEMPEI